MATKGTKIKEGTKVEDSLWGKIFKWPRINADKTDKKVLAAMGAKEGAKNNHHEDTEDKRERLKVKGGNAPETEFRASTTDYLLPTNQYLNWLRQGVLYLVMGLFFWLISGQTAISYVPGPSIHTGLYATFLEVKKRVPEDSALLT